MAYATSNPPFFVAGPRSRGSTFGSTIGSTALGGGLWFYASTHLQTDVATANFITNGGELGIKPNDVIMHIGFSASAVTFHRVFSTGISSTGGVHASAGLVVSSAS